MESIKRLSMNTSLKNARIFDDDAWEEKDGKEIKKEVKTEQESSDTENKATVSGECYTKILNTIKVEPEDDVKKKIKREPQDDTSEVKQEPKNVNVKMELKIEPEDITNTTFEEGEIKDNSICLNKQVKESLCSTPSPPPPPKISFNTDEKVDAMFDESPYNKELFNTLKIEESPFKAEDESGSSSRNKLKSARRSVFNRHSPYKRINSEVISEKRISAKSRLGPRIDDGDIPRKRTRPEIETDPEVIARREKQIEYGKNTIGYDNYTRLVPKSRRDRDDPQTPNKCIKYSRRGWDGLIRQWRLKLHKYDPPSDTTDTQTDIVQEIEL